MIVVDPLVDAVLAEDPVHRRERVTGVDVPFGDAVVASLAIEDFHGPYPRS